ncbi:class I SAM-dependent methyltransferase [Syntrophotalea acetylenivorans]|uniref:class I SAM-dependent methyltransferase n=1 Tax=Syntrophotalea acetylenivorans TaxID=1842532 RepID=UPI0013141582|nr:class I SAM-dependent methyltransferase [Syntrophotalea acetylenivorans]
MEIIKLLPRGDILEIGCGAGAMLVDLSNAGFNCTALETSVPANQIAKELNKHHQSTSIHLEPSDNWAERFDYIFAFEVLEHNKDDKGILEHWREWLKPNGTMVLSVPAKPELWNARDVWAGHYRRYDRSSITSVLKEAGFMIEHLESYGFPLFNLLESIGAISHGKFFSRQKELPIGDKFSTAKSGIDRSFEVRIFPLQASRLGKSLMKFFFFLQTLFLKYDIGNGYIVTVTKNER